MSHNNICCIQYFERRTNIHCVILSLSPLIQKYQNFLNEIGKVAEKCLEEAAKFGEVIIITNSDDGWVKFSAERYLPNLLPIIPKYELYPQEPVMSISTLDNHYVGRLQHLLTK